MAWDGNKWGQEDFCSYLDPDLANILSRTDLDFEIFDFFILGIPKFLISRSPDFQIPRSRPGPGLGGLGPARLLLRGGSAVAPRHSRTTKCGRSKELGQYRENPISESPVWGMLTWCERLREVNFFVWRSLRV